MNYKKYKTKDYSLCLQNILLWLNGNFFLGEISLTLTNLCAFHRHLSSFKISHLSVSNFHFVSNTPIFLSIAVKLKKKWEKWVKVF